MTASEDQVKRCFDTLIEPKLKWNINTLNLLKSIDIQGDEITLKINLITDSPQEIELFKKDVETAMTKLGFSTVNCHLGRVNVPETGIKGVKNIILVGSGKGGVGKSNVSVNLATTLAKEGFSVGLMDADIYGPSIPTLMGIDSKPEVLPNEYLMPINAHGVKTMSVGFLVSPDEALDWRGQMCSGTIIQFIHKTLWGELDYLVIDLPPGTGDITLTIAHKVKCNGILLVTTPSELAICDLRRAITLFEQRQIPILGLVENMSYYTCQSCEQTHEPFKTNKEIINAPSVANIETLGKLPLSIAFAEAIDKKTPVVLNPDAQDIQDAYQKMTLKVIEKLQTKSPFNTAESSQMA